MVKMNLGRAIEELEGFGRSPKERGIVKWNDKVSEEVRKEIQEVLEQARALRIKAEKELI